MIKAETTRKEASQER